MSDKETAAKTLEHVAASYERLRAEIGKVIVGQDEVVRDMLVAMLCRGHCLIVGVPGLAKTLLVKTLGQALGLTFRRIQFTPDLMPADITGTDILQEDAETGRRRFEFSKGPVFANLLLADEINRTPPKTQAALLEAMQERQVTAGSHVFKLEEPFLVFASQNPIEHEGTYPLPEAQLDRFFFCLLIDYPSRDQEREVVARTTARGGQTVTQVFSRQEILDLQDMILDVPVPQHVVEYVLRLVRATRPKDEAAAETAKRYVEWGASLRASQNLVLASKALAILAGRPAPSCEDVRTAARAVLRHRVIPNYNATGEGLQVEALVGRILEEVGEPTYA
jgi:MoxR-like ATPase